MTYKLPADDAEHIQELLDIVNDTFARPNLKPIHDAALAELEEISKEVAKSVEEESKAHA